MIEKLIDLCIKNKLFIFLITAGLIVWAFWSINNIPLDALPDLSDTQVIVYSRWDRPPQIIEDQVTYPIVAALLGAPKVKDIRAFSDYGYSYVYIIFDDGVDVYWARSRVLEYLSKVTSFLPEGVKTELGPDATGVGWVYEYALVDESGKHSLADLRSIQDWNIKYALQSVKGVSEVASVGGFVKQYQVDVNPNALVSYNIPLPDVIKAIKSANQDMGARLIEFSGREYMVTVNGYIKSKSDIEGLVLKNVDGVPVRIKDIGIVVLGPDIRRGISELNGIGEVVGGIVVMRYKENAMNVIKNVKEKIKELQLPEGVKLVPTYDRSDLIQRSIETLRKTLIEEMIVVALIIIIFLFHFSSSLVPIMTLPIATLISFIPIYFLGLTSNIMSLGGIAIAIGAMVDASIVVVENSHKRLSAWQEGGGKGDYKNILVAAIKEVGRSSFFSLLVLAVAFIPIFTLEGFEGRLFKPLAFTNNFAMFFSAVLAVTFVPALMLVVIRINRLNFKPRILSNVFNALFVGKIHTEEKHPISSFLHRIYTPVIDFILKKPYLIIGSAVGLFIVTIPIFFLLGNEFMPPLNEGSILYMPTTLPGISVTEATKVLQIQDRILKSFPEVESVFGKAGRAETSTDPAPFSMMETTVILKSQKEWRKKNRWYSKIVPDFAKAPFRFLWPDTITWDELINEMNNKLQIPGVINSWTLPIKGRTDMLTTGVRTPVGIKLYGTDLSKLETIGEEIERLLLKVKGTRSVFAERTSGGYFVNFKIKRDELARYNLSIEDVNMILGYAIGGENVTLTIEGRERYPINVRYPRELRDEIDKIQNILIPVTITSGGASSAGMESGNSTSTNKGGNITISQIADIEVTEGPGMIRDENGMLSGYVFIDVADRDIGSYVNEIKKVIKNNITIPSGYSYAFSGQYEFMERVKERLKIILPLTLLIIFVLIFLNTKSYAKTFIILTAVPFSLIGVIWILFFLQYNLSIGVWCGIIALLGLDAETGIFMLLYLDLSFETRKKNKMMKTINDLKIAIHDGAVKRIRPKMMTILCAFIGLLPIMWSQSYEAGADLMKRIAAPMVGGIFTSFLMELVVYPAIYFIWKSRSELKKVEKIINSQ